MSSSALNERSLNPPGRFDHFTVLADSMKMPVAALVVIAALSAGAVISRGLNDRVASPPAVEFSSATQFFNSPLTPNQSPALIQFVIELLQPSMFRDVPV